MGLLDYYRQFEGMSEEEVNAGLREEAAERRRKALTRVDTLDLSQTTWPELPHPRIVNAITFVARRGLHRYPHLHGTELRDELAERHGVDPARLILGNGAAELLSSATRALIEPGQQLLTPWPSYPLYPIMARRAHGRAVPDLGRRRRAARGRQRAGHARDRAREPQRPDRRAAGDAPHSNGCSTGCPMASRCCSTSRSSSSPTRSRRSASLKLLEDHPRLLVFRSFSKAWGLAGLRVGYAIGGPGSEELLAELEPDLGVSEVSQAGALEALRSCSDLLAQHVREICEERPRLTAALRERGFEVTDSQANFVWAAHPTLEGGELAARLARAGVLVAGGAALGEPRHVRIGLRNSAATERLLGAIDKALG